MKLNNFFVSHLNNQNQISYHDASIAVSVLFLLLLAVILFTSKLNSKSGSELETYFKHETSDTLRGIAILCLIFGHFAINCVDGKFFFILAGRWAVIIFLYISGVGLTKKYSLSNLPRYFIHRRIGKLMPSVWFAMTLFIVMDYVLIGKAYNPIFLILNYLGIITIFSPDGPAWYITYIIILYLLYYLLSKVMNGNVNLKLIVLFVVCYMLSVVIWHIKPLSNNIDIWAQYAFVFPSAVGIGLYFKPIQSTLVRLYTKHRIIYIILMVLSLFISISKKGEFRIGHLINSYDFENTVAMVYDEFLILAILLLTIILDYYRYRSSLLSILGKYSFEIFLIHLPFMQKYDFLLFRKPLILYFPLYLLLILLGSIVFKKVVATTVKYVRSINSS